MLRDMLKRKIKSDDLVELKLREELIKQHLLIVQALGVQKDIFMRNLLLKYGYGLDKNYQIDLKTGKVNIKKPVKKNEQRIKS